MKKILSYVCLILIAFSVVGCSQKGNTKDVTINIGKSSKFSKDELNSAVTCVKNRFNKEFDGCTLTYLWYDEVKSNETVTGYLAHGGGSINKAKSENVVVLYSNFKVGSSYAGGSLNKNSTYTNYLWILVRDSKSGDWHVDDVGY